MSNLPVVSNKNDETNLAAKIGEKLVESSSATEIVLLTQVRGEILRQDLDYEKKRQDAFDKTKDRALNRFTEKSTLIFRITMSPIALIIGCGLVYLGFLFIGYLTIGAGLWLLASELVKGYLLGGGNNK